MSRLYDLLYTIIFKLNTTVRTTPMYLSESEKEQVKTNLGIKDSGGVDFQTDETLTLKNGILSVNTTDVMQRDNTLPITSAGVHATVGNIEELLKTI